MVMVRIEIGTYAVEPVVTVGFSSDG